MEPRCLSFCLSAHSGDALTGNTLAAGWFAAGHVGGLTPFLPFELVLFEVVAGALAQPRTPGDAPEAYGAVITRAKAARGQSRYVDLAPSPAVIRTGDQVEPSEAGLQSLSVALSVRSGT